MDHLSNEARSALMRRVRRKDTAPELAVRKFLWKEGYRYRLHNKNLPGTPDVVFPSRKKVIFVHGCFWHGHFCRKSSIPKTKSEFWYQKFSRNKSRDEENVSKLSVLGWSTLTIWECEVNKPEVHQKIRQFLIS
ncbi:MAG TPA: very short patch repair endonuclease [Candidatus Binatia bacterium]|nr:very short patch repair endonuclease [Candidatus Binatia bacterium]